jgi:hypothetical protein
MSYFIATFRPQTWQGNTAIAVDPRGPCEWDVTAFLQTLSTEQRQAAINNTRGGGDILADDPTAPAWIREWIENEPFEIDVREQTTPLESGEGPPAAAAVHYQIVLDVKVAADTTELTAKEHADAVCAQLRNAIGNGILTGHEPAAEIDEYSVDAQVPR